jgi:hypothetical protein
MDTNVIQIFADAATISGGIKDSQLAFLCGMSNAKMSSIRNGGFVQNSEVKRMRETLADLRRLEARSNGIPINFRNLEVVKDLLENLRYEDRNPPATPDEISLDLLKRFAAGEALD